MIAELFTEGTSPFDLSQLLAYRSGEYSPSKLFQSIDDSNIRVRFCVVWNSIKILAVCVYCMTVLKVWPSLLNQMPIQPASKWMHWATLWCRSDLF